MNRLEHLFSHKKKNNIAVYLMAGDPPEKNTVDLLHEAVAGGANILEIGFPFSDPMAEGTIIQKASERSLNNNINLESCFEIIKSFRIKDNKTPIILMGYLNPVEKMGIKHLSQQLHQAGGDGIIIVDMAFEESHQYADTLRQYGLSPIFLISPTTTKAKLDEVAKIANGFVYYVSLKGVTGANSIDVTAIEEKLAVVKKTISLPIMVGFGINSPETAKKVAEVEGVSGVVIGSYFVEKAFQGHSLYNEVEKFSLAIR